jgi:hypothetical protein
MTDYRKYYDKDFIGAWDLADGDMTITITKCVGGSLTAPGGRKSKKPVVYFEGSEKGFALNATNGKTIAALYGNHVEQWAGKRITLYKSMTRSPQGDGDVECIRVRPTAPHTGGKRSAPKTESPPESAGAATPSAEGPPPSTPSLSPVGGPAADPGDLSMLPDWSAQMQTAMDAIYNAADAAALKATETLCKAIPDEREKAIARKAYSDRMKELSV